MEIVCIGDSLTVNALRLMSIKGKEVSNKEQFLEKIETTLKNKEKVILILPQRLSSKVEEEIDSLKSRYSNSLIVEIPDSYGPSEKGKKIEKMISSTLGIKI